MSSPETNPTPSGSSNPSQQPSASLPPLPPIPDVPQSHASQAPQQTPGFLAPGQSVPAQNQQGAAAPQPTQPATGAPQMPAQPAVASYQGQYQQPQYQQPAYPQPGQPGQPAPTAYVAVQPQDPNAFGPTLGRAFQLTLKVFVSVTKGRAAQAFKEVEDNRLYGLMVMAVGAIGFALLLPLFIARVVNGANNALSDFTEALSGSRYEYGFGPSFGTYFGYFLVGLVFWVAAYAIQSLVIFLTWRFTHGHGSFRSAMGVLSVGFTPISAILVVWALVSVIPSTGWVTFISILAAVSISVFTLGTFLLNYVGLNTRERLASSPFVPYVLLTVVANAFILVLWMLIQVAML